MRLTQSISNLNLNLLIFMSNLYYKYMDSIEMCNEENCLTYDDLRLVVIY